MLSAGTKIGPYEVVGALGAGGMGEVYRARHQTEPRRGTEGPAGSLRQGRRADVTQREAQVLASLAASAGASLLRCLGG